MYLRLRVTSLRYGCHPRGQNIGGLFLRGMVEDQHADDVNATVVHGLRYAPENYYRDGSYKRWKSRGQRKSAAALHKGGEKPGFFDALPLNERKQSYKKMISSPLAQWRRTGPLARI